ncbi:MAG: efflux RND transporter periplasmic adaptor subunit [Candidatus Glassbacteria bacterium]|nr:efflux RND transporter periplasmic adaptor subunit [Candidatus Glassbacteria bacterium]
MILINNQGDIMQKLLFWILAVAIAASGLACRDSGGSHTDGSPDEHGHGGEAVAVTLWTDRTELFMEYPPLVAGQPVSLVVHLTALETFEPVRSGTLTVELTDGGKRYEVVSREPARTGIYLPEITVPAAGTYRLNLHIESEQVDDRIEVGEVQVYQSENLVPHADEAAANGEEVSFLKEQQWQIEFQTALPQIKSLNASVKARGEILPAFDKHARVPALAAGFVDPVLNAGAPQAGEWVEKGQTLVTITPSASSKAGFAGIRGEYLRAKAEYVRAERLLAREAVPERRLDEARLRFEVAGAAYRAVTGGEPSSSDGTGQLNFTIRSPLAGVVDRVGFELGEEVTPGQPLFTVTDPHRVRLEVMLPITLYGRVDSITDAVFSIESSGDKFVVSELNGKLLSVGQWVNRQSRTVPVVFEMDNPERRLKINMFAEVSLYTGQTVEALSIPDSAILDDNGQPIVYVQAGGESFVRREIETGVSDRGFTQVLDGIGPNDRVVTAGAYQVKLASLTSIVPSGHGHAH